MSRHHNYVRHPCELCGKPVSNAGFGYKSHMRMHVRRGEAREVYAGRDKYGTFTKFEWPAVSKQEATN